jgi:hypothetical protein
MGNRPCKQGTLVSRGQRGGRGLTEAVDVQVQDGPSNPHKDDTEGPGPSLLYDILYVYS